MPPACCVSSCPAQVVIGIMSSATGMCIYRRRPFQMSIRGAAGGATPTVTLSVNTRSALKLTQPQHGNTVLKLKIRTKFV